MKRINKQQPFLLHKMFAYVCVSHTGHPFKSPPFFILYWSTSPNYPKLHRQTTIHHSSSSTSFTRHVSLCVRVCVCVCGCTPDIVSSTLPPFMATFNPPQALSRLHPPPPRLFRYPKEYIVCLCLFFVFAYVWEFLHTFARS